MTLGQRIKSARKAKKITQRALAREIGCCNGTASLYESGGRNPPLKRLRKIAEILGVDLTYFVIDSVESSTEKPSHACGIEGVNNN